MKKLLFVASLCVLSSMGIFAQGSRTIKPKSIEQVAGSKYATAIMWQELP